MLFDVPSLLRAGAAHVPSRLVGREAHRALAAIPPLLPACTSVGGFECRLESEATRVDFSACIQADDGGRDAVAAWLARAVHGDGGLGGHWASVLSFFRHWTNPSSVLFGCVPVVWIEFDLDPASDGEPSPFLIFTLTPPWDRDGTWTPEFESEIVLAGIDVLAHHYCEERRALVRECVRALHGYGWVLHAALRPRGRAAEVRLILKMTWQNVPRYLEQIAAPVDISRLNSLLQALCTKTLAHSFHLDVGATIGTCIGIEFFFPTLPPLDPRWQGLLDQLEDAGVCCPAKRQLISAWPGQGEADPAGRYAGLSRELVIKVNLDGDQLRAKAYLPFYPYSG